MKGDNFSDKIKQESNVHSDAERSYSTREENKALGDVDELIFPDDEPYYISER